MNAGWKPWIPRAMSRRRVKILMNKTMEIVPETEPVNLEIMERSDAPAIWAGYRTKFEELKSSADLVLTCDPALPTSSKLARTTRLSFRSVRIGIEAKRKELGEGLLRKKQAIDGEAKALRELIEPYEEKLLEIEEHAERVEAERIRVLTQERTAALAAVGGTSTLNLGAMPQEEWDALLSGAILLDEKRKAEAKKLEEERIAKEQAEAEDRERIRKENERLRAEAEAREREIAAERAEVERLAKIERDKAESKAREDREAREKAEAELARKKREEEERLAEKQRLAEEAELAPDREKLKAFAAAIRALPVPTITSERGRAVIAQKIEEFAAWVDSASKNLRAKK